MDYLTEKNAQYIRSPLTPKRQPLKREPELKKVEGRFESQSEYRNAYDCQVRKRVDCNLVNNLSTDSKRAFETVNGKSNASMETTNTRTPATLKKR